MVGGDWGTTIRAGLGDELRNAVATKFVVTVKYLQVPRLVTNCTDEAGSFDDTLGISGVSLLCGKQISSGSSGFILQTRHIAPHGNDSTIDDIDIVSVLPQHDVSGAGLGGSSGRLRGSGGNLINVSSPTLGGSSGKLRSSGGNRDDGMLGVSSVMGELGMSSNLSKPRRRIQRATDDLSAVAHIGSSNNSKSIGVTLTTLQFLTVFRYIDTAAAD